MIWIPLKNFCRVIRCTSAKWPRTQLVSGWEIQAVLSICNHVYFLWNMNRKTTVTCCEILSYHFWVHAIRIITRLVGLFVFHFSIHPRKQDGLSKFRNCFPFLLWIKSLALHIKYNIRWLWKFHSIKGWAAFIAYALSKFGGTKISHHGHAYWFSFQIEWDWHDLGIWIPKQKHCKL